MLLIYTSLTIRDEESRARSEQKKSAGGEVDVDQISMSWTRAPSQPIMVHVAVQGCCCGGVCR